MLWMHKRAHCAIETMSRVEARETEKKISQPCADANREIKFDYGVREGERAPRALYAKIERTRSRASRNLILRRARAAFISACRSREYRQRRINSFVESAALCATIDRDDKFSLSRGKKGNAHREKFILREKEK